MSVRSRTMIRSRGTRSSPIPTTPHRGIRTRRESRRRQPHPSPKGAKENSPGQSPNAGPDEDLGKPRKRFRPRREQEAAPQKNVDTPPNPLSQATLSSRAENHRSPANDNSQSRDPAFADTNHATSRHSHKTQVTPMSTPTKPQPRRGKRKQPRTKSGRQSGRSPG